MQIDLLTIFPEMFAGVFQFGVVAQSVERGSIQIRVQDLRTWADPPRHGVDDQPYGGGAGMVFRPEPLFRAIAALRQPASACAVVRMTPRGERLTQGLLRELADYSHLVVVSDRYEGSDERAVAWVTHEISLGDFVLTGGELPAMLLVDGVCRLIPGVVGRSESIRDDSFSSGDLDHAHFTRPQEYRGSSVPVELLSGNHRSIAHWRRRDALRATLERRPDLAACRLADAEWVDSLSEERLARLS